MGGQPTQSDIARAAGVTRGAVSQALSGRPGVSERTRRRIVEIADRLGYVRNLSAATLAGNRHSTIGVVLPDLRNPYYEDLVTRVQETTDRRSQLALMVTTFDDPRREATVMHKLREIRVGGILAVSPAQSAEALRSLADLVPLALVGVEPIGGAVDTVHMDEDHAAVLVADHLRTRGWTRVLHLMRSPGPTDAWAERRRQALTSAFEGFPLSHEVLTDYEEISPVIERHRTNHPDDRLAIVTHNDILAIDVVPAIRGCGLVPGRDIAIVSYDDSYLAARPEWSLTSVHQDSTTLVDEALGLLLERDPAAPHLGQSRVIAPTLVARSTT